MDERSGPMVRLRFFVALTMTTIEPLRPADWTAALERALERLPAGQRAARLQHCLQLLQDGTLDPRGIFVARDEHGFRGVQVCVPLAGSACLFWLPVSDADCVDGIVQAALAWCASTGCKIAHAAPGPDELVFAEPLLRNGFQLTTRLLQLAHDLNDLQVEAPTPWRCEAYRPSLHSALAATLERTYEGTLDCPELNGKRGIDEIIAGHRGQGKFHPEFWWLVHEDATPIGVVILVEMPDGLTWELAYLGIVPEYRRRGIARALTLRALHALRAQAATRVLLGVDARNAPALALYQSLGFVETDFNYALLYFW
jgi:GNAT superfamily N-acetyltransferase